MRFARTILAIFGAITLTAAAPDATVALGNAETTGAALFAAMQANNLAKPQDIKNFDALQRAVDPLTCPGTTLSWILLPDATHATRLFGIAAGGTRTQLVVGKHFKANMVDGAVDLATLAASTKSCLTLNILSHAVGVFTTELDSATPTEFHVVESSLHNIALFVNAGGEVWSVKDGKISKVKQQ